MKVILGAGGTTQEGWVSTEKQDIDVRKREDFERFFGKTKADAFFAEHLFEHLTPEETFQALANIHDFLASGGNLRIAVPDGNHPDQEYIDWVKPNGVGPGCDSHYQLFTCDTLVQYLRDIGFVYILVEWWEDGKFYSIYTPAQESLRGRVDRCYLNDERNSDGQAHYTSLIVDAWRRNE